VHALDDLVDDIARYAQNTSISDPLMLRILFGAFPLGHVKTTSHQDLNSRINDLVKSLKVAMPRGFTRRNLSIYYGTS
jgi:hypothetical protein